MDDPIVGEHKLGGDDNPEVPNVDPKPEAAWPGGAKLELESVDPIEGDIC